MGAPKGGGYIKKEATTKNVSKLLEKLAKQSLPLQKESAEIFRGFGSPTGSAAQSITNAANKNFQQQTIPSILNAFGSDARGSSALNQTLAAGASDLNTNIAAQLGQQQLSAAQGLGNLGSGQAQLSAGTPQFAYAQRAQPFWQSLLGAGVQAGGQAAGGYFGRGV